jgi:uncharacterized protein (DUF1330 family)
MSAYMIVYRETPIRDEAAIAEYSRRNYACAAAWRENTGLQPIVVYGAAEALEGSQPDGVVVLRFPTIEQARAWYQSPEYQDAMPFRKQAADWRVVLVEGLE